MTLSARPSEYFFRSAYIATDPEEEGLRVVIEQIGDERIVLSTDYPTWTACSPPPSTPSWRCSA